MPKIRHRSKHADKYTLIDEQHVPAGIDWRLSAGPAMTSWRYYYSMGKYYKKLLDISTGKALYYKKIDEDAPPARPRTEIDLEPRKLKQVRYRVGTKCWFVDTDKRWYLVEVIARTRGRSMTIRPMTGRDAAREVDWPFGGDLEFPGHVSNRLYQRLRPLTARKP